MSFDPLTSPVDYFLLAGERSPGIAEVTSAPSPRELTERKGYGTSGAFVVFRGIKLVPIKITIKLYTPEDWAALKEAMRLKDRTVFLDIRTDPTENVWPMVKAGKGISEMLLGSEDL
mgnify:CR=1 FL=1